MMQALVSTARQCLAAFQQQVLQPRGPAPLPRPEPLLGPADYQPLQRLVLTDGVSRTLFEEFRDHRDTVHGQDETGWVLLGLREVHEAVALATLPAGAQRDAGLAHVRFNATAQALGSRIVRQADKRLSILGVVHTHPGSLRHPSDGDFQGDSPWVAQLRGREGVFGIGTADGPAPGMETAIARQPRDNVQALGELTFSWYSLRQGDSGYRPLTVGLTLGPDLARPLHRVWPMIEAHAGELERLFRQQAKLRFGVQETDTGAALTLDLPLAEPGVAVRVLLREKDIRYFLVQGGELYAADVPEERVDRGVYLLLAELAGQD